MQRVTAGHGWSRLPTPGGAAPYAGRPEAGPSRGVSAAAPPRAPRARTRCWAGSRHSSASRCAGGRARGQSKLRQRSCGHTARQRRRHRARERATHEAREAHNGGGARRVALRRGVHAIAWLRTTPAPARSNCSEPMSLSLFEPAACLRPSTPTTRPAAHGASHGAWPGSESSS
eukprot:5670544-Prymnesium_polylepis.1